MPVLFDYLESELATFDQKPFGPLDSAVLSQACLIDGAGVVPTVPSESDHAFARLGALLAGRLPAARFADLMRTERFATMFVGLVPDDLKRCLFLLASSPRYRDLELRCYRNVFDDASHTQFCAMAFVWHDEFAYVGFRGTDASFTGWREDLDMAYKPRVRSQGLACSYLGEVADLLPSRLHVGGHSKGGNLALFAALSCSDRVRARIERVWCHDAPGFLPGTFTDEDYVRLGGRVHRTVPQDSIVGMMLDCPIEPRVVESRASGILQHDVFSWEVDGDDFRYRDGLGDMSAVLHDVAAEWLASCCTTLPPNGLPAWITSGWSASWRRSARRSSRAARVTPGRSLRAGSSRFAVSPKWPTSSILIRVTCSARRSATSRTWSPSAWGAMSPLRCSSCGSDAAQRPYLSKP